MEHNKYKHYLRQSVVNALRKYKPSVLGVRGEDISSRGSQKRLLKGQIGKVAKGSTFWVVERPTHRLGGEETELDRGDRGDGGDRPGKAEFGHSVRGFGCPDEGMQAVESR